MGYNREVYDSAMAELERRRADAQAKAAALHERVVSHYPRVLEIEQEMAHSAIKVARAVLDGGDVTVAVDRIKSQNLSLQAELAEVLSKEGVHTANFEPQYTCPLCGDTGYHGGQMCECLQTLLREEACRRISRSGMIRNASFDTLSLEYYPDTPDVKTGVVPRMRMKEVLTYCRCYAEDFGPQSPSLLLRGPTGTGKTHVSLAIAQKAVERGYGVVYGPVQQLLHKIEKEHFGREYGSSEDRMTDCDLLILDDLGAEFAGPFYQSCLYNLINSRMLSGRPTVISTNLDQSELMDRYGEQITSRVIGTFVPLAFMGRDIRQLKLQQKCAPPPVKSPK